MQRAIPPDSSRRVLVSKNGTSHHEAVGDLHLAADNFAGAIDAYGLALAEAGRADVPGRVRLQLRIVELLRDPAVSASGCRELANLVRECAAAEASAFRAIAAKL